MTYVNPNFRTKKELKTAVKNGEDVEVFEPGFSSVPSDGADEKYAWLGDMPGVREWLGDRVFNELRASNYTLANKLWESSLSIKKTDLADDRTGMYGPLLGQLGAEATYHPDELWFNALVPTANRRCASTANTSTTLTTSWGDSGTQSNDLTYDATDHTAVTAAEFKAAFHQAREAMLNFSNDQGKLFHRPTVEGMGDLMVLVPTELELAAKEGITAILSGGGNTNVVLEMPTIVVSVAVIVMSCAPATKRDSSRGSPAKM